MEQGGHGAFLVQHIHRLLRAADAAFFEQARERMAAGGIKAAQAQNVDVCDAAV